MGRTSVPMIIIALKGTAFLGFFLPKGASGFQKSPGVDFIS